MLVVESQLIPLEHPTCLAQKFKAKFLTVIVQVSSLARKSTQGLQQAFAQMEYTKKDNELDSPFAQPILIQSVN